MQVGKNVVVAVGVAFVAMIAIIFFLLGRESKHPPSSERIVQAQEVAPEVTPSPPPALPPSASPSPPSPPPSTPPPPLVTQSPRVAAVSGEATAVRDYFRQMDSIQAFTGSTDTGEFANTLLTGAMNGDMSGFDNVLKLAQDGADRARAISPPAACKSYHDNMLALLGDGVAMLKQLMDAIKRNDTTALASLVATGDALKARSEALEAAGKAIKTKFGISN